ncbi:MAG: hypothetical protein MUO26_01675 [Methanotrichaceae archaeon]|nr:hypothetical protein [Methanotrichaceae archaeon]
MAQIFNEISQILTRMGYAEPAKHTIEDLWKNIIENLWKSPCILIHPPLPTIVAICYTLSRDMELK